MVPRGRLTTSSSFAPCHTRAAAGFRPRCPDLEVYHTLLESFLGADDIIPEIPELKTKQALKNFFHQNGWGFQTGQAVGDLNDFF